MELNPLHQNVSEVRDSHVLDVLPGRGEHQDKAGHQRVAREIVDQIHDGQTLHPDRMKPQSHDVEEDDQVRSDNSINGRSPDERPDNRNKLKHLRLEAQTSERSLEGDNRHFEEYWVHQMAEGKIKRMTDKGFGFIEDGTGKDMFFHSSAVEGMRYEELREGQQVSYNVGQGPKGPRAENVLVI